MYTTEDEARKKYCPVDTSQSDKGGNATFCQVYCCMMWRWLKTTAPEKGLWLGYCGLAGKPEPG